MNSLTDTTSGLINQLLTTGMATDQSGFQQALSDRFSVINDQRSADVREQLGGLGMRFSTDMGRAQQELGNELALQQSAIEAGSMMDLSEAGAGRQLATLAQILGVPGQLQQLAGAGFNNALTPFNLGAQFGTGGVGSGQSSSGKSANLGVGIS
jgi:hypothetical protein